MGPWSTWFYNIYYLHQSSLVVHDFSTMQRQSYHLQISWYFQSPKKGFNYIVNVSTKCSMTHILVQCLAGVNHILVNHLSRFGSNFVDWLLQTIFFFRFWHHLSVPGFFYFIQWYSHLSDWLIILLCDKNTFAKGINFLYSGLKDK